MASNITTSLTASFSAVARAGVVYYHSVKPASQKDHDFMCTLLFETLKWTKLNKPNAWYIADNDDNEAIHTTTAALLSSVSSECVG